MNKINTFSDAVRFACTLCDAKPRTEKYSIEKRSHILAMYGTLKKKNAPVTREYNAKAFIEMVDSFKQWLNENPRQSIIDTLYNSNILLFDYSTEIVEVYNKIKAMTGFFHIVIEDINDVVMVDGKYYYASEDGLIELGPENIIIRQSDASKQKVSNKIVYMNITNEELRKQCGTVHPSRGWYAYKFGANYYYTSNCMVKHWFEMSDDRKEFACGE